MKPVVVLSNASEQCLTFAWSGRDYYVGYRFVEGQPLISDEPLSGHVSQPAAASAALSPPDRIEASAPRADWWLEKLCLQQCLRYTGGFNEAWRQSVARTLFLSELDMQAMGNPNQSLTYARRDGRWFRFPVEHTVYPTQAGRELLPDLSRPPIDHGLIVRESPSRKEAPQSYRDHVAPGARWDQVASGMYWERMACVSNRHPADRVHAWIDFGPLEAGQPRTVRGKFYFIEGTKDDLLAAWRKEFASAE